MTISAPELRILKDRPHHGVIAGDTLELLVVAASDGHCAGVDLATGALVRTWSPDLPEDRIRPFDVVAVTTDDDNEAVPDPAQPEAIGLVEAPRVVDRMTGRRCERLLRALLHPQNQSLLGISGTVIPFWQRSSDHPSIAIVEPQGRILLVRDGAYLGCRFEWQGHERELPCMDRALAGYMDRQGRTRLTAGKGDRLVVALTGPIEGRCHKVVETLLRRG
ncbi:MAG TPA: hypothetical protein VG435_07665 [Acidimicrobiales bacterium]|nr:hypothetical protein [Acidimicrobiales bacterium]